MIRNLLIFLVCALVASFAGIRYYEANAEDPPYYSTYEPGWDRPGGDYKSFRSTNSTQCAKACEQEAYCRAWTYMEPHIGGPYCWLKSSLPPKIQKPGLISGAKSIAAGRLLYNFDLPGWDYARFRVQSDPHQCKAACERDGNCRGWTYVNPGVQEASAICYLKSQVPPYQTNGCCVSGGVR